MNPLFSKSKLKLAVAAMITWGGLASGAYANSIVYSTSVLVNPSGDVGSSIHGYTAGGITVTAFGYLDSNNSAINLFGKSSAYNSSPSEQGLGLTPDTADHEIDGTDFIQLDVGNLVAAGYTQFTVTLGSLQTGETGRVSLDSTPGLIGDAFATQSQTGGGTFTTSAFTISATNHYIDISGGGNDGTGANTGDVILNSFTATSTVPDGGSTVLLLGLALIGLATVRRKVLRA